MTDGHTAVRPRKVRVWVRALAAVVAALGTYCLTYYLVFYMLWGFLFGEVGSPGDLRTSREAATYP